MKISNVQLWSIIILLFVFLLYIIHININLYDRYIGELGAVVFTRSTIAVPNITLIIIVGALLLFISYLYTKRQPEGGKE